MIAGNTVSDTKGGAIVGTQWREAVTGDLALAGAARLENFAYIALRRFRGF